MLVVAIPSVCGVSISYGILKMVKLGIKRLKAKLWLKLWLKIPKRILLTRFNIYSIIGLNAFLPEFIYVRRFLCKFVSDLVQVIV